MRQKSAIERAVAETAARQHGVVATVQLLSLGVRPNAISRRVAAGRLHRLHRGVYAVGHRAVSREGMWMAAVLAIGGGPARAGKPLDHWGATISHRSAAELWGLLEPADGPVDVCVAGDGGKRRRKGIRLHRSPTLLPALVTLRSGIPVTTPARTILDLRRACAAKRGGAVGERELRRAARQAAVIGLPLAEDAAGDRTRSELERAFLRLCRRARLPMPEVNVRIGRDLVDFLWRERRLVVETDGYLYHRGRFAFENDRDRDLRLRALGFEVIRFSDRQIDAEPSRVAAAVRRALRVSADAPGP
jgi:very-short-patch-repair endonuclease/predicted transcriptional regulator of viral defense system